MSSIKKYVKSNKFLYKSFLLLQKIRRFRIIVDTPEGFFEKPLPNAVVAYPVNLDRDKLARDTVFSALGTGLNFLDFGGGDGKLTPLLGNVKSVFYEPMYMENKELFEKKFNYYGVDLDKKADKIITGDVCASDYMNNNKEFRDFFDIIYSNNVFEHLNRPWIAVENIYHMLKPGGICIIIAPFSWRYHEVPGDYYRYTHAAFPFLFKSVGSIEVIQSGYDLNQRRIFNQGNGSFNDLCPTDNFGPWRESWHMISLIRKV